MAGFLGFGHGGAASPRFLLGYYLVPEAEPRERVAEDPHRHLRRPRVLSIIPVLGEFEVAAELADDWSLRARREVNRWHEPS